MKLEFYRYIFEKYYNIKSHENPSTGSRVVPCGRTDRHEELFEILRTRLKNTNVHTAYTYIIQ